MSLIATYTGMCQECDGLIEPGDIITSALDGYVHTDCTDGDEDFPLGPISICSDCFLTTPCFCD